MPANSNRIIASKSKTLSEVNNKPPAKSGNSSCTRYGF